MRTKLNVSQILENQASTDQQMPTPCVTAAADPSPATRFPPPSIIIALIHVRPAGGEEGLHRGDEALWDGRARPRGDVLDGVVAGDHSGRPPLGHVNATSAYRLADFHVGARYGDPGGS